MIGLIFLLLAVAIPLGITVFTVLATKAELKACVHAPVGRLLSAVVFGASALLGVVFVFRGTSAEYAPAIALIPGMPAAIIAAILAVAGHRLLVGRSMFLSAAFGAGIAFLTAVCTSSIFAALFAPDSSSALFIIFFGAAAVLMPNGILVLAIGACSGLLLSYLSNRRQGR